MASSDTFCPPSSSIGSVTCLRTKPLFDRWESNCHDWIWIFIYCQSPPFLFSHTTWFYGVNFGAPLGISTESEAQVYFGFCCSTKGLQNKMRRVNTTMRRDGKEPKRELPVWQRERRYFGVTCVSKGTLTMELVSQLRCAVKTFPSH